MELRPLRGVGGTSRRGRVQSARHLVERGRPSYCLSCSRTRAAELAGDAAPDSISAEDRMRLKRRAIIAFEIDRLPAAPNRTIASACRTSSKTVAVVREEMLLSPASTGLAAPRGALR